jgi:radical SAM superfamily enzyme YgiQ (UPF0313 family)
MRINNRKEVDLRYIKINTLLLYPPTGSSNLLPLSLFLFPMGISQLKAFLNSKNYKRLKVVNLEYNPKLKLKIAFVNYFFKKIMNSILLTKLIDQLKARKIINKLFLLFLSKLMKNDRNNILLRWSLNQIINTAIEYQFENYEIYQYIKSLIKKKSINLVGFSVVYPHQILHSLIIARMIKSFNKNVFIVMGGPQVTKHINYLIKKWQLSKFVDGFIINDGEEPLAQLIYQLENSRNFSKVPNFYFKKEHGGYTKSNYTFSCDSRYLLAPDFDGFYSFCIPIRISFGCLWGKCTFCTYRLFHKKYSCGKIKQIIEIIKNLQKRYKINRFQFVDDYLYPTFLKNFSRAILKENIKIFWECHIALVPGFNKSIVKNMVKSGCRLVSAGLESMSQRLLRLMNKPHNPKLAKKILKLFKDSGLKANTTIIFGFPTETRKEALITLNFLKNNRELFNLVGIQQFCLEENTIIFNEPKKFGITKIYTKDKNYGIRLGYQYEVNTGMSQKESRLFAKKAIKLTKFI